MQATSHYDLLADLAELLTSYVKLLPLEFSFGNKHTWLHEVFMKNGFLTAFICDKQPEIDQYIAELNKAPQNSPFFAKLVFHEKVKDTYFGYLPEIEHNLVVNTGHSIDMKPYYGLLEHLGHSILASPALEPNGNTLLLDVIYDKMELAFNSQTIKIIPEEKVLASNHV